MSTSISNCSQEEPIHRFYQRAWQFFASLRLTLVVLILLAIALIVGMFWDQTLSLDEQLSHLDEKSLWTRGFLFFELNDVFHSWWFGIVVLLLALNLIACSIERLPPIWIDIQNPEVILSDGLLKKLPYKQKIILENDELARKKIDQYFLNASHKSTREGVLYAYTEKHKYARCGVYAVHIALLLIMFGSMATTQLGIDGMMVIPEKSSQNQVQVKGPGGVPFFHTLDFDVVCVDFRLKTYTDGSPMAFESDLAVYDKKKSVYPVATKTIRVNEPLSYGGYTFYQSSYQRLDGEERVRLAIGPHGGDKQVYLLPVGTSVKMPDGTVFVPLEVSEDYGSLGPAVRIQQLEPGQEATHFLVFRQYPDFDPLVRRGKWDVFFQGFDQPYATGISVGRVPGIECVFLGFAVMFLGLYMAFAMSHRRYYARLKLLEEGKWELVLAGSVRRHVAAFSDEFQKWAGDFLHE